MLKIVRKQNMSSVLDSIVIDNCKIGLKQALFKQPSRKPVLDNPTKDALSASKARIFFSPTTTKASLCFVVVFKKIVLRRQGSYTKKQFYDASLSNNILQGTLTVI